MQVFPKNHTPKIAKNFVHFNFHRGFPWRDVLFSGMPLVDKKWENRFGVVGDIRENSFISSGSFFLGAIIHGGNRDYSPQRKTRARKFLLFRSVTTATMFSSTWPPFPMERLTLWMVRDAAGCVTVRALRQYCPAEARTVTNLRTQRKRIIK